MTQLGRGRHYGWWRTFAEPLFLRLTASGWPARLAYALGAQRVVDTIAHDVVAREWPAGLRPLTFAFASDFHAGPTTHPKLIELAFERMAAAEPDVLLLGGDFIFIEAAFIEPIARAAERMRAPFGKFAVLGNHDLWTDYRHISRRLEAAGVQMLINDSAALPAPFDHVSVCGVDEGWSGDPDPDRAFANANGTRILLIHSPCTLRAIDRHRFDVAVCGHTHGGHLALPGGRPLWIPQSKYNAPYFHGRFQLAPPHHGALIVSRGIGALEVPFRTYAPPDVVVCRLGPTAT
ncbi:MAG: metallophosphoesterase family protein [bacterium]